MKLLSDLSTHAKLRTPDMQGLISLNEYRDSTQTSTRSCTTLMDDVIRQTDAAFKNMLHTIRKGTMDDRGVDFWLGRRLENLNKNERETFKRDSLCLMTTWDITRSVILPYLKSFNGPYVIIKPIYSNSSRPNKNHCVKEMSYPTISEICIGAVVMLLKKLHC